MQDEPEGQEPEEEPDEGTAPPTEEPQGTQAPDAGPEDYKRREQQLRAEIREERAKRLVKEFDLPDATADLLKLAPKNEMEERAKVLAEELKARTGTPASTEEPSAEPDNAEAIAAMGSGGEGKPPVKTPSGENDELLKAIDGTKSTQDLEQMQVELRMKQKEAPRSGPSLSPSAGGRRT